VIAVRFTQERIPALIRLSPTPEFVILCICQFGIPSASLEDMSSCVDSLFNRSHLCAVYLAYLLL
jgi:hypothetical protein